MSADRGVRLALLVVALLLAGACLAGCAAYDPKPVGIPGRWTLTLNAGPADLVRWHTWFRGHGPVNSAERACYKKANVAVKGAALTMSLTAGSTCGEPYTGALRSSHGIFSQRFGAFEARVFLPGTANQVWNWPAFWLDGVGTWPVTGELDVMEGLGGKACYHFHSLSTGAGRCVAMDRGWHIFGAVWKPGKVTYYYDGRKVGSLAKGVTSARMYVIIDYTTARHAHVATMRVAWVRAWTRK